MPTLKIFFWGCVRARTWMARIRGKWKLDYEWFIDIWTFPLPFFSPFPLFSLVHLCYQFHLVPSLFSFPGTSPHQNFVKKPEIQDLGLSSSAAVDLIHSGASSSSSSSSLLSLSSSRHVVLGSRILPFPLGSLGGFQAVFCQMITLLTVISFKWRIKNCLRLLEQQEEPSSGRVQKVFQNVLFHYRVPEFRPTRVD